MKKTVLLAMGTSIAALLAASSAFAAQNVANTNQKGSLLKWPYITTDPTYSEDTIIEISNDGLGSVHVECEYVNEQKGRQPFDFTLTSHQTFTWDVATQAGDGESPPPFPTWNGGYSAGDPYRGELACWATDKEGANQVAYNELVGEGTVLQLVNDSDTQPKQAYRYNAWSFIARGTNGLPQPDDSTTPWGPAGYLTLDGGSGPGHYDACPLYLVQNFMPNGARLGNLTTFSNSLHVVGCNQDLREAYTIYLTKLLFSVWNEHEQSQSAYECVDSVTTVPLSDSNPGLVGGSSFDYSTLKTQDAKFIVQGIPSAVCPGSIAAGLLGVFSSSVGVVHPGSPTNEIGSDTSGEGAAPGFLQWDPGIGTPPPGPAH
jgi:hypothetical protein